MKLKELKERALISADEIGNEAEYKNQLVEAVNKVQNKLVVFSRNKYKYGTAVAISKKSRNSSMKMNIIQLPKDCYDLVEIKNNNLSVVNYMKINNSEVAVPAEGQYTVKYKAFLPNITIDTPDDYEIDIEPIAEPCMVVGVASWIAVDNPEMYDVLNSEYNNLLANLSTLPEVVNENSNSISRIEGWYW